MRPYIEVSTNEVKQPEIAIHCLTKSHLIILEELTRDYISKINYTHLVAGDNHIKELHTMLRSFIFSPEAYIQTA